MSKERVRFLLSIYERDNEVHNITKVSGKPLLNKFSVTLTQQCKWRRLFINKWTDIWWECLTQTSESSYTISRSDLPFSCTGRISSGTVCSIQRVLFRQCTVFCFTFVFKSFVLCNTEPTQCPVRNSYSKTLFLFLKTFL